MDKCFDLKNSRFLYYLLLLVMKSQLISFTDCNKTLEKLCAICQTCNFKG